MTEQSRIKGKQFSKGQPLNTDTKITSVQVQKTSTTTDSCAQISSPTTPSKKSFFVKHCREKTFLQKHICVPDWCECGISFKIWRTGAVPSRSNQELAIDLISMSAQLDRSSIHFCFSRSESQTEDSLLQVCGVEERQDVCIYHHFCLWAVGADRKIETEDQSGRNEPFPHQTLAGGFLENHRLFGSES